jgi:glycosyltransferase involved in cell wall biosynthesis
VDPRGSIEWLGWKHDMPRWFAESHVICLPTSYGEGIPRVLLEGSASARAIVATDLPGCRRVVRHGDTGLLVRAGDPEQLADAIETLVRDAALRSRMGAAGRRRTAALFDESVIATKYLALYDRLRVARA